MGAYLEKFDAQGTQGKRILELTEAIKPESIFNGNPRGPEFFKLIFAKPGSMEYKPTAEIGTSLTTITYENGTTLTLKGKYNGKPNLEITYQEKRHQPIILNELLPKSFTFLPSDKGFSAFGSDGEKAVFLNPKLLAYSQKTLLLLFHAIGYAKQSEEIKYFLQSPANDYDFNEAANSDPNINNTDLDLIDEMSKAARKYHFSIPQILGNARLTSPLISHQLAEIIDQRAWDYAKKIDDDGQISCGFENSADREDFIEKYGKARASLTPKPENNETILYQAPTA